MGINNFSIFKFLIFFMGEVRIGLVPPLKQHMPDVSYGSSHGFPRRCRRALELKTHPNFPQWWGNMGSSGNQIPIGRLSPALSMNPIEDDNEDDGPFYAGRQV